MTWKKSSAAAVKRFETNVAVPGAERGVMFGCPTLKLNGQLYAMLFGDDVLLRVSPEDREALLAAHATPFEVRPGTKSKKTLVLPKSITATPARLRKWVTQAAEYALSQGKPKRAAKART